MILITLADLHSVTYSLPFLFDSIVLVQDMQSCMFANGVSGDPVLAAILPGR